MCFGLTFCLLQFTIYWPSDTCQVLATECMIFRRYFWPLEWAFGFGMALALRMLALGPPGQSSGCTQVTCPTPLCVKSLVGGRWGHGVLKEVKILGRGHA